MSSNAAAPNAAAANAAVALMANRANPNTVAPDRPEDMVRQCYVTSSLVVMTHPDALSVINECTIDTRLTEIRDDSDMAVWQLGAPQVDERGLKIYMLMFESDVNVQKFKTLIGGSILQYSIRNIEKDKTQTTTTVAIPQGPVGPPPGTFALSYKQTNGTPVATMQENGKLTTLSAPTEKKLFRAVRQRAVGPTADERAAAVARADARASEARNAQTYIVKEINATQRQRRVAGTPETANGLRRTLDSLNEELDRLIAEREKHERVAAAARALGPAS